MWNYDRGIYKDGNKKISLTKKQSEIFNMLYEKNGDIVLYNEWKKMFKEKDFYIWDVKNNLQKYVNKINKIMDGVFVIKNKKDYGYYMEKKED